MPTETQVKRLIADTVFEAHRKLCAVGRLETRISRERARNIAGLIFDELHRSNSVFIDEKPNLKVTAGEPEAPISLGAPDNLKVMPAEGLGPRISSTAPDPNFKLMTAERRELRVSQRAPDKTDHRADLARALLGEQHMPEHETGYRFGKVAAYLLFVIIILGIGIVAYAYFEFSSVHCLGRRRVFCD